jgi:hypothetical protein
MANVCFGCHDVAEVETCPKKDCVHYSNRNKHLEMDTVKNEENARMIKRNFRFTIGV